MTDILLRDELWPFCVDKIIAGEIASAPAEATQAPDKKWLEATGIVLIRHGSIFCGPQKDPA